MNLDELQPTLQGIIVALPAIVAANATAVVRIDDGQQAKAMESDLKANGLTILIYAPHGIDCEPAATAKGYAWIDYSTTVWVRTDPHVKAPGGGPPVAKWNPLTIEASIIPAVMQYSRGLAGKQFFRITRGAEPETDFTDPGNFSRFVRFETRVLFQ